MLRKEILRLMNIAEVFVRWSVQTPARNVSKNDMNEINYMFVLFCRVRFVDYVEYDRVCTSRVYMQIYLYI